MEGGWEWEEDDGMVIGGGIGGGGGECFFGEIILKRTRNGSKVLYYLVYISIDKGCNCRTMYIMDYKLLK